MKRHRVGEDLIRAISAMEEAGEGAIAFLLLELAQFRLLASIKSEIDAVAGERVAV